MEPYYIDDMVTLYQGDMREVLPQLGQFDCAVTDPPYGETSLAWDRWPDGWPSIVAEHTASMWCFGSMRMFLDRRDEFGCWKLSQDVVWRKPVGTGFTSDRFVRVHEHALYWYRGQWGEQHRDTPRDVVGVRNRRPVTHGERGKNWHGEIGDSVWIDDGTRLAQSVLDIRHMHKRNIHHTEKPTGILDPLIRYACPPGDLVLDPFAGSGSTAVAARMSGRRTVLVEADERYCEAIVKRLQQDVLPIGGGPAT